MIIDQLPILASVQETDEIPVERGTTTYKATLDKIAPVRSVNGQTGAVTLTASGILTNSGDTVESAIANVKKREFILIGDSFGGGVDGDNNTQSVAGGGWIQRFADNCGFTVYSNPTPLTGVFGFASSRPFLDVLQNIETVVPDKTAITDIVVLGGTNDIGIADATVIAKIAEFVPYCKTNFPNARVAIGCIGTAVSDLVTMYKNCYSKCETYGAEPIHDTMGLFCFRKYIGADGVHLTAAGYAFYQEFINPAIITGKSRWRFTEDEIGDTAFTLNTSTISAASPVRMTYNITNDSFSAGVVGSGPLIANMIAADASLTTAASIGSQNIFTPIVRNVVVQAAGARSEICVYFDSTQNVMVLRPYGFAADFNPFGPGLVRTISY